MVTHFPFLVFVCSLMFWFSWCNCRLPMQRRVLLCLFLTPSSTRPSRCFCGTKASDWAVPGEQGDQTKTTNMSSRKRSIFPLRWLTKPPTEPVSRWSLGLIEGRTWRRWMTAFLSLQSQQRICCSADLHSIIRLIYLLSNPLLSGFWHVFVFWGSSQQFAKSTGLHKCLPILDKMIIHPMLSWGGGGCPSSVCRLLQSQIGFVPWSWALPQPPGCKDWS